MTRWFVAMTPLVGAMILPLAIPLTMSRFGIGSGVTLTLFLSILWFLLMLRTSEMPH